MRSYEHYLHHRVSCLQKLSPAASTTSVLRLKNFWTIKNLERVRENQRVSQMWIVISASLCEFTTDKPFLVSYLFHVFFLPLVEVIITGAKSHLRETGNGLSDSMVWKCSFGLLSFFLGFLDVSLISNWVLTSFCCWRGYFGTLSSLGKGRPKNRSWHPKLNRT